MASRKRSLGKAEEEAILNAPDPNATGGRDMGMLAGCGLLIVVLLCAGGGLTYHFWSGFRGDGPQRPRTTEEGSVEAPVTADPIGGGATTPGAGVGAGGSQQAQDAARAAMRQRYRPGPYVQVQGLLPSGLTRQNRLTSDQRQGRTIDNPWIVPGAQLRAGDGDAPTGAGPGMRLANPSAAAVTVVAGVPSSLDIVASPGPGPEGSVQALLIRFQGYPGHFYLPAVVDSELGQVRVTGVDRATFNFGIDSPVLPGGTPIPDGQTHRLMMYVSSVDVSGRVSAPVAQMIEVLPLGSGDVEVTLSMGASTDLDLYVVEGTGQMVYYGNTRVASGGHLDLDANAACSGNRGVNTEHVYWPQGRAPAGTYQVRVAHYQSCIGNAPVDYRVTVRNCGETAVFTGRFEGPGRSMRCDRDPGTDRNWCQAVVSFDVTPCAPGGAPQP